MEEQERHGHVSNVNTCIQIYVLDGIIATFIVCDQHS